MKWVSTIKDKWKLFTLSSIFCCFILLLFLNQNDSFTKFSFSTNTALEFTTLGDAKDIAVPPKALLSTSPPPPLLQPFINTSTHPIILPNPSNFTPFYPKLKQSNTSTPTKFIMSSKNFTVHKLEKLPNKKIVNEKKCDIFDGKWVYKKKERPRYDARKCPFIEEKVSCRKNGRPDLEYEKWRWQAKDCNIPLFDGRDMLERLRNKRVIIVGDSLNRNMWESLSCLLYTSIPPSKAHVHAKLRDYKVLKAKEYNTIIEFHWSPFLVEFDENHTSGKKVVVVDKLSPNSIKWRGAHVMVFNSGHWWIHTGKFKPWDLFQYKGRLMEKMSIQLAYEKGMKTWAKWIKENVNPKKTTVFFRSISTNHNFGKQWCYNATKPTVDETYLNPFPKSMVDNVESLIKGMTWSHDVKYLNITKLSQYRNDAHPSLYRSSKWKTMGKNIKRVIPSNTDCSHWCLPGLPDTWNRLLYASLFFT